MRHLTQANQMLLTMKMEDTMDLAVTPTPVVQAVKEDNRADQAIKEEVVIDEAPAEETAQEEAPEAIADEA